MSKGQTAGLWRGFIKNNLTQRGSQIVRLILMSHMKVIKIGQKYFHGHFEGF